jgi:Xaa-Pro aminopeptidase
MLTPETLPAIQAALAEAGVDGWLLYDFRGINPISRALFRSEGIASRRMVAWIPRRGIPVAITHAIEPDSWAHWPPSWERRVYSSWKSLESEIASIVKGKKAAMEYSPGDAVPVVDCVPAGVIEMVRAAGATVVTSADLVSRFFAVWTEAQLAAHRRAAEIIARLAKEAFARAGAAVKSGAPLSEYQLMMWLRDGFTANGLFTDHGPNVSATENAANPHYEPSAEAPRLLKAGDCVLIDLWALEKDGIYADQTKVGIYADQTKVGIYADQTWMASIGAPSAKVQQVWNVLRDARDAAITLLREGIAAGRQLRGADVDDAARGVIERAGFGAAFTHRTGHSIDARAIHGSGPNLDNLETREERVLIPGVGFSIEPGIYLPGEFGMRTEVNAYIGARELLITPNEIQRELIVV